MALAGGIVQPVLAVYGPGSLPALRDATPGVLLTETVLRLDPARVALPERLVLSVNTSADLEVAEAAVRGG